MIEGYQRLPLRSLHNTNVFPLNDFEESSSTSSGVIVNDKALAFCFQPDQHLALRSHSPPTCLFRLLPIPRPAQRNRALGNHPIQRDRRYGNIVLCSDLSHRVQQGFELFHWHVGEPTAGGRRIGGGVFSGEAALA